MKFSILQIIQAVSSERWHIPKALAGQLHWPLATPETATKAVLESVSEAVFEAVSESESEAGYKAPAFSAKNHSVNQIEEQHLKEIWVEGVETDTRRISGPKLFVPLKAARDGHEFLAAAVKNGALAALCEKANFIQATSDFGDQLVLIEVADTSVSLFDLAGFARSQLSCPVVAITGSVAKTSIKDMCKATVGSQLKVHVNEASFNNEIGVPLTICNAPKDCETLIVEMGARGIGHINKLCQVAKPNVAVLSWVGPAHTSEFGSIEAVGRAKAEVIEALGPGDIAVINADCETVRAIAAKQQELGKKIIAYSSGVVSCECRAIEEQSTVDTTNTAKANQHTWNRLWQAEDINLDSGLRASFCANSYGSQTVVSSQVCDSALDDVTSRLIGLGAEPISATQMIAVKLQAAGAHQVSNALAAIAVAEALGLDPVIASGSLAKAETSSWRMEIHTSKTGAMIINDAYNANSTSMLAALEALASTKHPHKTAVLSTMAELGERHEYDHELVAKRCGELGIDIVAINETAYGQTPLNSIEECIAAVGEIGPSNAILFKASRSAGLEAYAQAFQEL